VIDHVATIALLFKFLANVLLDGILPIRRISVLDLPPRGFAVHSDAEIGDASGIEILMSKSYCCR